MSFPFQIARRYLFSKKSVNIINLISILSVIGVAVGTLALIVVLSAFNGISSLVDGMLSSFDADLKVTAVEGKHFDANIAALQKLSEVDGVIAYGEVVQDNALATYQGRQKYVSIKGVDYSFAKNSGIDSMMVLGNFKLKDGYKNMAALGYGVAVDLGVGMSVLEPIHLYYPKRTSKTNVRIDNALNHEYIFPSGIFSVQQDIDQQYVLVPIHFAQELLQLKDRLSSVELRLAPTANVAEVKGAVQEILGDSFKVQDRYEQNELIYQVMKSEKWASFLILGFILLIASFNLLGSLTMIILDKKKDIFILRSMGADATAIRKIFLIEGWMISLLGALVGLVLGIILVWLQMEYGLVKLPNGGSFAVSAYPVVLEFVDVLATLAIVLLIGAFVSWYPTRNLKIEEEF